LSNLSCLLKTWRSWSAGSRKTVLFEQSDKRIFFSVDLASRSEVHPPEDYYGWAPSPECMESKKAHLSGEEVKQSLFSGDSSGEGCATYDKEIEHQGSVDIPFLIQLCKSADHRIVALICHFLDLHMCQNIDSIVDVRSRVLANAIKLSHAL